MSSKTGPNNPFHNLVNDPIAGTFLQLIIHLGQYRYAMEQLRSADILQDRYAYGFYSDAMLRRIGDWFAQPPKMKESQIDHALRKVGIRDQDIKPVGSLLDSAIGKTTWRRLIKYYRNAASSHEIFELDAQRKVCVKHGISLELFSFEFVPFIDSMSDHVEVLQSHVENKFHSFDQDLYTQLKQSGIFKSIEGGRN